MNDERMNDAWQVDVEVNGRTLEVPMRLGEAGEAYFLQKVKWC